MHLYLRNVFLLGSFHPHSPKISQIGIFHTHPHVQILSFRHGACFILFEIKSQEKFWPSSHFFLLEFAYALPWIFFPHSLYCRKKFVTSSNWILMEIKLTPFFQLENFTNFKSFKVKNMKWSREHESFERNLGTVSHHGSNYRQILCVKNHILNI